MDKRIASPGVMKSVHLFILNQTLNGVELYVCWGFIVGGSFEAQRLIH